MKARPTYRGVILVGSLVPLSLLLILIDETLWPVAIAALGAVLFLIAADWRLGTPFAGLVAELEAPRRLHIGHDEVMTLKASIPGESRGLERLEVIIEAAGVLESLPAGRLSLSPDEISELDFQLHPQKRGMARLEKLWLRWLGPLGLVAHQRLDELAMEIPVIPNIRAVRDAAAQLSSSDAIFGVKPQRQQGEGSEFQALRDYVPGLDPRTIDWKHSARHRALLCKEFQAERNHNIVIALDTGHLMSAPLEGVPRLDHAINAGLMLAYTSLHHGDRVSLFAFDAKPHLTAQAFSGPSAFGKFQRLSADLNYSQEEANFTLGLAALQDHLKRRSLIIFLTDFVDTVTAELMVENLGRMAGRHLILFVTFEDPDLSDAVASSPQGLETVTRGVIASDFRRERSIVLERLRRMGVHCLEVRTRQLGFALINRYLEIKRLELV